MIREDEILNVLKCIEEGKITIQPATVPNDVYSGNILYNVSNGWEITIFNDCNTWDYIEHVKTSDGRHIDFDEMDMMPTLRNYEPQKELCVRIYKIG